MVRLKDPVEVRTSRSSVRDAVGMSTPPARPSSSNETHGTIVVVEDDRNISDLVDLYLRNAGFRVLQAGDAARGLELVAQEKPYLVLLDIGLPGAMDGLELCRALRRTSDVPVIIITARDDEVDRVLGLELGADDYLSKPFNPRELVARVRAILRRASNRPARAGALDEIVVGPIVLHAGMHQVRVADRPVALTGAEFRVLEILMRSAGQVISRDSMTEQALGRKLVPYDRSIDTHISNLRRKLELEAGKNPEIKNVRGSGYTLTCAPK